MSFGSVLACKDEGQGLKLEEKETWYLDEVEAKSNYRNNSGDQDKIDNSRIQTMEETKMQGLFI